ncbi:MAG: PQQ-binding-like beta-propeller repeat protein [Armatimonadota bacterium]
MPFLPIRLRRPGASRLTVALAALLFAAPAVADWTQWRGPRRDGTVVDFQAPAQWPAALAQRWKVEVGEGHSSPLLVGDRAFLHSRQGEEEVVRCLDAATGREMWKQSYPASYEMHPAARGHGKGPKSTPLCAEGRLYTLGISGILSCFDAKDGSVVWRKEFSQEYPKTSPLYGTAVSPLLADGLLIAHVGGHDGGALTAFDAKTGAVRWRWAEDGPAYSSPLVVTIDGVRQLVTQTQGRCVGLSLADGTLLWSLSFKTPFDQNSISPVQAGDLLVFGGTRQPTFAVRVRKVGDGWQVDRAWDSRDATFYMSTPVYRDGKLYGFSERQRGQFVTLDAATGRLLWEGGARSGDNAALLLADGYLLGLTTDADLLVFRPEGEALTEVARYEVAESPTWATPAIDGRRILIKDLDSLVLWELPR